MWDWNLIHWHRQIHFHLPRFPLFPSNPPKPPPPARFCNVEAKISGEIDGADDNEDVNDDAAASEADDNPFVTAARITEITIQKLWIIRIWFSTTDICNILQFIKITTNTNKNNNKDCFNTFPLHWIINRQIQTKQTARDFSFTWHRTFPHFNPTFSIKTLRNSRFRIWQ